MITRHAWTRLPRVDQVQRERDIRLITRVLRVAAAVVLLAPLVALIAVTRVAGWW